MTGQISRKYLAVFSLAVILDSVIVSFSPIQALTFSPPEAIEVAEYVPPKGLGVPPTGGGGTRGGSCSQDKENTGLPLTALMPALESSGDNWGLTVEANPQIFVYVPNTSARTVELALKDEDEKDVYRTNLPISGEAEIVSLTLPKNSVNLEVGKSYHWYFSIICNSKNRRRDVSVDGWTKRVEMDSTLAQIEKATPRDRANLYAKNGIWHEALASLSQLQRENPNDSALAEDWKKLLESAGLKEFDRFPVTLINVERSP
ncbi:DUF928 domain-containing protein [Argonema galeatum]|uniref:DUF928 domain-containing protein n=1 Tax=Argonema galeatum TaxID=2942762 RepID=UPI002011E7F6|nr:DUF928 domain-containing protein [Argonema galeatum]MCL1465104.1 DUF928 domain-containing protein [Argonema galeatum A003/A1]